MDTFEELQVVIQDAIAGNLPADVSDVGSSLLLALLGGNKILTCGNGGSATDAAHLSEELLGKFSKVRRSLPAVNLGACPAALTCIANDFGFPYVFSRQIESMGEAGDILVAFSTSGDSENILRAIQVANKKGVTTILVTGKSGGIASGFADKVIRVPSTNTARIQELHTLILHTWLKQIEAHESF
jgi:D-sedoheptulose 7-phosphate isomerase